MTADRITALEEALKLALDYVEGCKANNLPDLGSASSLPFIDDVICIGDAALAASSAAPDCHQPDLVTAAQVRIKPLVWNSDNEARGIGCTYTVWGEAGGYKVSVNGMGPGGIIYGAYRQVYRTVGDAKAAAQADYEARILAALDLTPAPAVEPRTVIGGDASVAVCPICDIAGCKHVRGEAPAVEPVARRTFPILGSNGARIDYQLVVDHGGQAKENHYQTVDRLAERGGLSWCELHAVLNNRKYTKIDQNTAIKECRAIEAEYLASIAPTAQDAALRAIGGDA